MIKFTTMSDKPAITPEARLAEALMNAVNEGVNLQRAFEQIPGADRPKVRALLSGATEMPTKEPVVGSSPKGPAIIIAQPKEVKELVESLRLEKGYAEELERHQFFELLRTGEKAPDFGQVLRTFTPEMLAAAQSFQNPELRLITKGHSFNDLVTAMDGHKIMRDQKDVYVDGIYKEHASRKPEQWGAHIIEAPTNVDVQDFDDTDLALGERIKRFTEYKESRKSAKVGGMDRLKYAHLMMQALKKGEPIDDELWTMLDEDPALSNSDVPLAFWYPNFRVVYFVWGHSGVRDGGSRLRRSVGGIVQG